MTKVLILTIAIVVAAFANSVVGRKSGEGQKEYLRAAASTNAHR